MVENRLQQSQFLAKRMQKDYVTDRYSAAIRAIEEHMESKQEEISAALKMCFDGVIALDQCVLVQIKKNRETICQLHGILFRCCPGDFKN